MENNNKTNEKATAMTEKSGLVEDWSAIWALVRSQPDSGLNQTKWKARRRANRHIFCTYIKYDWYEGTGCPLCDEAYKAYV
jgi:hypothetical protein